MDAENKESCLQRDSAERKGVCRALAHSTGYGKKGTVQSRILGKILNKDN